MPEIGTRNDPYKGYNFKLTIKEKEEAHFTECSGLGAKIQVIDYRAGGEGQIVRRLPGQVQYPEVTFRYGLSDSKVLFEWFIGITEGKIERRNVSVAMLNDDGKTQGPQWNLLEAWPSEWRAADLNALGKEVAIETLKLAYERLERV
jgi:phage tail-like protein